MQPLRWCCVDCMIHHEQDVREEQKYIYVARTSNKRVISSGDLYCCLLPQCDALRTCRSGFPIKTVPKDVTSTALFFGFTFLITNIRCFETRSLLVAFGDEKTTKKHVIEE